jgi:hypothetical protein
MSTKHTRKANEVDANGIEVHFSSEVKSAFADLAAAAHFSKDFDADILSIVQDWAAGKPLSVHSVFTALPLIAEETSKHARATGDERAAEAWRELCLKMSEKGFTLTPLRRIGK